MLSLLLEHRILFLLLPLSAVLHGGVLWYQGDGNTSVKARAETPISLALVQPAPATVSVAAQPIKQLKSIADNTTRKQNITRPHTAIKQQKSSAQARQQQRSEDIISKPVAIAHIPSTRPATSPIIRQSKKTVPEPQPQTLAQPADIPQQQPAPVYSQLQAALQSRLRFNRYYPRSAIRRGWEGRVELSVQIDSRGQIGTIRILQSSGHSLLDQAAIQSIEGLARLPEADILLDQQAVEITVPVIYRLE